MKIAMITAGAAGMYCGSCLRDNTLVAALNTLGHDALLIPTYTPIRTDEVDVSGGKVFYGGINVYLQDKSWLFRQTPRWLDRLLDGPKLLRAVSSQASSIDYADLAGLTVSMLAGQDGRQRKELDRLVTHLKDDVRPEAVILTNALLGGLVPTLHAKTALPIYVTLQGDDIFLEALPPVARAECLRLIRKNDSGVRAYLATSHDYAERMSAYFGVSFEKMRVVHPGINVDKFSPAPRLDDRPPTVGYFARICPEKGFHNAVTAFIKLKQLPGMEQARFHAAGWRGDNMVAFYDEQLARLSEAGVARDFQYDGSPDFAGKVKFYQNIDVLTLPAEYAEPKGLSVLESWATGVPAVLPAHGSFPELVNASQAGLLYTLGDHGRHAQLLAELLLDANARTKLGTQGLYAVRERYTARVMAQNTVTVLESANSTP